MKNWYARNLAYVIATQGEMSISPRRIRAAYMQGVFAAWFAPEIPICFLGVVLLEVGISYANVPLIVVGGVLLALAIALLTTAAVRTYRTGKYFRLRQRPPSTAQQDRSK